MNELSLAFGRAVGFEDLAREAKASNAALAQINNSLRNLRATAIGSFTMPAAATLTVLNPTVTANCYIDIMPTNASAASLMSGAKSLYHNKSAIAAGVSFQVATADGTAAAGTETFDYIIFAPI